MAGGIIKPKKLFKGATIGVMAPSGFATVERIERGVKGLTSQGFKVQIHPQCSLRDRGSGGTTKEKITALHDIFADPSIDAVWTSRGGSRAMHMLDGIDYELIRKNPKLFIGFSDTTALQSAFYARSNLSTIHGAHLVYFGHEETRLTTEATLSYLLGDWKNDLWPVDYPMQTLHSGESEGALFGGNMQTLMMLLAAGNGYVPDLHGKILVVEDVAEEKRSIDRMFGALRLAGVFDKVAGLIVGQMTGIVDTDTIPFDRTVEEIVLEHTAGIKGPVVLNAPIGHEHPNIPFPLGIKARLMAPAGGSAQLQLLESPFADA